MTYNEELLLEYENFVLNTIRENPEKYIESGIVGELKTYSFKRLGEIKSKYTLKDVLGLREAKNIVRNLIEYKKILLNPEMKLFLKKSLEDKK